ncbi:hypothetical protein XU06_30325 (plasmid) [Rhodococcus erythropolis]|uniref:hypothetical protein n=1 Tax=Rhodococcus erythropolis TaxID=1833 RepID=UPI00061B867D|nr:hypothetical protein [Rhodococcus erythropolis]AKE01224.1 hypothetical protein XU06_30325 [Rhodococcus erythropolis]
MTERIDDGQFGSEHFGQRAYREGDWKLIYAPPAYGGSGEYALYDLATDPGETNDLAAVHPCQVRELAARWNVYTSEIRVVPGTSRPSMRKPSDRCPPE